MATTKTNGTKSVKSTAKKSAAKSKTAKNCK